MPSKFSVTLDLTGPELWRLSEAAESHGKELAPYLRGVLKVYAKPKLKSELGFHRKDITIPAEEVMELRDLHWSWAEIAKKYGVSERTVKTQIVEGAK